MRLIITSDTHGFERGWDLYEGAMPEGDVLIHCGDYSRDFGSWLDTVRFARWFGGQPHAHKLVCPGNHDYAVHENPAKAALFFRDHGITMVGVDRIVIDGISFDGTPAMPISGYDPPFGFETEEAEREKLLLRIQHVDVLITHTPPKGILDQTAKGTAIGCWLLRHTVLERIKPRLHCFGHVHESRGMRRVGETDFLNASCNTRGSYVRDDRYNVTHMTMGIRAPFIYEIEAADG